MSEALGYNGTAGGEAGHPTSTDRAETEANNGKGAYRQSAALGEVRRSGFVGSTWKELADARGWHHGQASSALSNLHRRGMVVRLDDVRQGCGVYVLPENVHGRETVAQGRRYDSQTLARDVPLAVLQEALRIALGPDPWATIKGTMSMSREMPVPPEAVAVVKYPVSLDGASAIGKALDKEYGPGLVIRTDGAVAGWMVLARDAPAPEATV